MTKINGSTCTAGSMRQVMDLYSQRVMKTYTRFPVVFERGEGCYLWDEDGRQYLDFLGGFAVNGLGHCHPAVVTAIQRQAEQLIHVSNVYHIRQQAELADRLCRLAEMDRAFFGNSGAEANEAAIKIARKRGRRYSPGKIEIVACEGSFHGRTLATLALTGQPKYQQPFEPLIPGVRMTEWNDPASLADAVNDSTCAIFIEPIQGEIGVRPASQEYLEAARRLADEHGALLVFDEIQTGCARSGKMYAWQQYGVKPDVLTTAKMIGGGVPIGACLAHGEAAEVLEPGDHGTTYGGGPLACAAAIAALDVVERQGLAARAEQMGQRLRTAVETIGSEIGLDHMRGMGLMLAAVLKEPRAKQIVEAALGEGLLLNAPAANVIRLLPALIIEQEQIDEACQKLAQSAGIAA